MPSKPAFSRRCRCPSHLGGHVDSNALAIYLGKSLIYHKISEKSRLNSGRKSVRDPRAGRGTTEKGVGDGPFAQGCAGASASERRQNTPGQQLSPAESRLI